MSNKSNKDYTDESNKEAAKCNKEGDGTADTNKDKEEEVDNASELESKRIIVEEMDTNTKPTSTPTPKPTPTPTPTPIPPKKTMYKTPN